MKTLRNILFGVAMLFNASQLKAQNEKIFDSNIEVSNFDNDAFPEEKVIFRYEGVNWFPQDYDITIVNYGDEDNDNFYENITLFHCDNMSRIIYENFLIHKESGLIDYFYEKYPLFAIKDVVKYFDVQRTYKNIVKNNPKNYFKVEPEVSQLLPSLTKEDFEKKDAVISSERIKKLINTGQSGNSIKLKALAESERKLAEVK